MLNFLSQINQMSTFCRFDKVTRDNGLTHVLIPAVYFCSEGGRRPPSLSTPLPRALETSPQEDPERTPRGPREDPERTPRGPREDPERTARGPREDRERTPRGPREDRLPPSGPRGEECGGGSRPTRDNYENYMKSGHKDQEEQKEEDAQKQAKSLARQRIAPCRLIGPGLQLSG